METKHYEKFKHYVPLIGILFAGIIGFSYFYYDKFFRFILTLFVAAGYVTWGVYHHKIHDDYHPKIFVEYFLIALLGVVIVFSLIFRG